MQNLIAVLVVEDEAMIRMAIATELEDAGYLVYDAASADAAIALLDQHREIRVMFTDVDMPGSMNGMKLAAAARRRWPPVRVIVTSGSAVFAEETRKSKTQFIAKPYDTAHVVHSIGQLVYERRA